MRIEPIAAYLGLTIALCVMSPATAADPPAKAPAAEETLSEGQQSLLLQLSDAEANIRALNIALARTGYKVGQAYSRIDSGQKGNELMNRKGGGPVGWQDFYGKTARDFYIPDSETTLHAQGGGRRTADIHTTQGNHPIQRPSQFDAIYKANADQVARAKEQVASLAQDQATLLARRQKHEADQSRLWAMLSFGRITDREIADEPLCRFKLTSSASAADSRVQILRAIVLFLRTADRTAGDGVESVQTDQAGTFTDLAPRMKAAYATLRASLADAMLGSDLKPDDKKLADSLKAVCKQLWDESSIVADNYRNALDRDQAKEDNSKLIFREKLQESLAKFSATTAELDAQVADVAKTWGVTAEKGVPTTDALPQVIVRRPEPSKEVTSPPQQDAPWQSDQADLIQVGTVWTDGGPRKLTILERDGEHFKAEMILGSGSVKMVTGTIRDGKFWWLRKDVQAVKGGLGGDNYATIHGNQLVFIGRADQNTGTYILRLTNPPVPQTGDVAGGSPGQPVQADPIQVGTVWTDGTRKLTILERKGEHAKARFDEGSTTRIVSATVRDGKFWWLATDIESLRGNRGGDNIATIHADYLDFTWRNPNGKGGTFTLHLDKSSVPK